MFADLITHESYTRYLTTLFGHLHRDPPLGYARTSVSQLVSADKTVWQMLLEEGVQPKRDESGELALDVKLMESLQSYRVSFFFAAIDSQEGHWTWTVKGIEAGSDSWWPRDPTRMCRNLG